MPEGPLYFPDDTVSDQPEETWVAELVREQLLAVTHDELPYSIATRVTEWEWPRIRCEIIVERESQKGMVIGKGGAVLKEVGKRARAQLPEGCLPRAVRQGRQGLAAQARPRRATRLLMAITGRRDPHRRGAGATTARRQQPHLAALEVRVVANGWDNAIVRVGDELGGTPSATVSGGRAHRQRATVVAGAGAAAAVARTGAGVRRGALGGLSRGTGASAAGCPATAPPRLLPATRRPPPEHWRPSCSALHHPAPSGAPTNPFRGVALHERALAVDRAVGGAGARDRRHPHPGCVARPLVDTTVGRSAAVAAR